eukprot:CAMPEP_0168437760 /NCGR_PEP_ID=MMETSP0228-20121227/41609_1 /TAXON_ID=133427 /ORGANISM="Protoceratium reticulatum, Strain CCCM 535 (=CCMP 1889)" /LENGTH=164 /DNA_ID=CAMNT_0008452001 /DNA_START=50 /DNA_END=542 /DNA_ORIENTATION=+
MAPLGASRKLFLPASIFALLSWCQQVRAQVPPAQPVSGLQRGSFLLAAQHVALQRKAQGEVLLAQGEQRLSDPPPSPVALSFAASLAAAHGPERPADRLPWERSPLVRLLRRKYDIDHDVAVSQQDRTAAEVAAQRRFNLGPYPEPGRRPASARAEATATATTT